MLNQNENFYEFEFLKPVNLSDILHSQKYQILFDEIEKINNFKEEFQSCEFVQIKEMIEV